MAKYINARNTQIKSNNIAKKSAKIGALTAGEKLGTLAKGTEAAEATKNAATALKILGIML